MAVLKNIAELIPCGTGLEPGQTGRIANAALAWRDDSVAWLGSENELPEEFSGDEVVDARGCIVVPGLVDAHTHLCFGGWRADEFEMRCRGAHYLDIARAGGGIMRTVAQTRALDEDTLFEQARERLDHLIGLGVTTVECKSGYGLTLEDELKILRVYARLREAGPARVVSTFLGAHVVPTEYRDRRDAYVDLVCNEMLPAVASEKLASYCDVFVEDGAFTSDEARQIFSVATSLGLGAKLHVDQLSDGGGAALAAEVRATSADHLEFTGPDGIARMVAADVIPVTLPVASLYLRQPALDARLWIEAGAEVCVATDFNPGSAPTGHLPLAMTLACTMNRMTPDEALLGASRVAARAIGVGEAAGSIEVGRQADFVLVDAPSVNHWLYNFEPNRAVATYIGGARIDGA